MKVQFNLTALVLLLLTIAFLSGNKNAGNGTLLTPPPAPADTLKGKDFTFSDLRWKYRADDFNELYTSVENRPDLFFYERATQVFVKSILDTTWIEAQRQSGVFPGYIYTTWTEHLYVIPYPFIYPMSGSVLAGSKVSVKVRFP